MNECRFGELYIELVKGQYEILMVQIREKIEDIHQINIYSMEADIRLQIFTNILKSDNNELK